MKFILNEDNLTIEEPIEMVSGSVNYYEIDVEHDSFWNDLIIKAIIVDEDEAKEVAVLTNKIFLDAAKKGKIFVGFVGYKIENEKKTYQISTNLKSLSVKRGAGEVETEETTLPTISEWEIYIAQIKEMLNDVVTEEVDPTVPKHVKKITEEDIKKWNSVDGLEELLQDILDAIESGISASMIIEEIEQLIVSYLETKTVKEVEA